LTSDDRDQLVDVATEQLGRNRSDIGEMLVAVRRNCALYGFAPV
jgi:hypothetical protein